MKAHVSVNVYVKHQNGEIMISAHDMDVGISSDHLLWVVKKSPVMVLHLIVKKLYSFEKDRWHISNCQLPSCNPMCSSWVLAHLSQCLVCCSSYMICAHCSTVVKWVFMRVMAFPSAWAALAIRPWPLIDCEIVISTGAINHAKVPKTTTLLVLLFEPITNQSSLILYCV